MSRGADFIARGSGAPPVGEEPLPAARWAEAVAILVTGRSSIAKLGHTDVTTIAVNALMRAAESVPAVMRSPEVRAAISVGSSLAETRSTPAVTAAPTGTVEPSPELLAELRLVRSAIDELKAIPAPAQLMPVAHVSVPPAPTTLEPTAGPFEAYFERRIRELEAKSRWAQERGDKPGARTAGTQLTKARKRLRELQASAPFNPAIAGPK
jgi:hypothetical protein